MVVAAGTTVFEISHCDPTTSYPIIEFTSCDDSGATLQVKKNGGRYMVSYYSKTLSVQRQMMDCFTEIRDMGEASSNQRSVYQK